MTFTLLIGDVRDALAELPDESVNCVVTSPPYWGLRDYGTVGQLGLERTPGEYVTTMTAVFRDVRRVLRSDGTLWLNMGDSYNAKELVGTPWMLAFALRADGWHLRSEIIWAKPNPMPESVRDRPTRSHETIFLLSKKPRYYFDQEAVREPYTYDGRKVTTHSQPDTTLPHYKQIDGRERWPGAGRNIRTVWTVTPKPFKGAHFATFPPKLVEPCVLAGSPVGGVVLDPFLGSGTTAVVALQHGRDAVGIELNPEYAEMARKRVEKEAATQLNLEA